MSEVASAAPLPPILKNHDGATGATIGSGADAVDALKFSPQWRKTSESETAE